MAGLEHDDGFLPDCVVAISELALGGRCGGDDVCAGWAVVVALA